MCGGDHSQRAHIYDYYGIRAPEGYPYYGFGGPSSIIVVYLEPPGKIFLHPMSRVGLGLGFRVKFLNPKCPKPYTRAHGPVNT